MPQARVNGTTLNYQFDGPEGGDVVMFSNSLASDLAMWDLQVPPLSEAGYRVLRYDGRGHGRSAVPSGPYAIEMLASDAIGLADFLGLGKFHFCGLSLGGMVGQMMGALHGGRLISLTLCDTSSFMSQREVWDERFRLARTTGMGGLVDATIDRWFTKAGQERIPNEVEKIRRMILGTPVEGYCGCGAAIREMDMRETIRGISTRTLVMVGEQDQGTPISAAEFIHNRIRSSILKIIPDAAHFVNVEQAVLFNEALLGFLAS
ncbi:MAG: 3-oxoadipate enol-lactonase [Syntrophus sp. (in: bacteria)]|nr:3-oxoadipate enol-lactonase [Syntrophus sp. (in: bacteria)]